MGWASGSELADEVWALFREHVPEASRKNVAKQLVDLFEGHDCDTMQECERLMKDAGREGYGEDESEDFFD